MPKRPFAYAAFPSCFALTGSPAAADGIDRQVDAFFDASTGWYVNLVFSPFPGTDFPWIVAWLVIAATVFTFYFGFIQFRAIPHSLDLVRGKFDEPNAPGEVSHFQALATALSGTVGLGNIAGVAVAIGIGGPGATFWMILAGLLGMASKFTECTLGVKYRDEFADGTVSGGPMHYLVKGFRERGLPGGYFLAVLFSVFCILGSLGGGNMFQANQAHAQITTIAGDYPGWITGIIFAALLLAIILGGLNSIARVTAKIVPAMGIVYVLSALAVAVINADKIPWAIGQILEGAFTGLGVAGGFAGALIQGFKRAAFSNEAGVGSSAIAHSAVRTNEPITEGYVALLEPFIDSVVVCTLTAFVIIISGQLLIDPDTGLYLLNETGSEIATVGGNSGVELTSAAFSSAFAGFEYILAIAVVLFAFSTMITWSYYGLKAWVFLLGEGRKTAIVFKVAFCLFAIVGASADLDGVIDFSDAAVFSMAVINIIGLYLLMPIVKAELARYKTKVLSDE